MLEFPNSALRPRTQEIGPFRDTPFAKKVMNLQCTFCHQGNDPREEAPAGSMADMDDDISF